MKHVTFLRLFRTAYSKGVAHDPLAARPADQFQALRHVRRLLVLDAGVQILFVSRTITTSMPGCFVGM